MNTIKFAWWNIANASNDEKSELYRYAQREEGVVKSLIEYGEFGQVSIMELRVCQNKDKTRKLMPEELGCNLAKLCNLSIAAMRPQNLDYMSFWRMNLYNEKNQEGMEFNSQCLGTCEDFAVDIVNAPRTSEDNKIENQCQDYRNGIAKHFIELDKNGEIVRIS